MTGAFIDLEQLDYRVLVSFVVARWWSRVVAFAKQRS
jgi:hypothetical protein